MKRLTVQLRSGTGLALEIFSTVVVVVVVVVKTAAANCAIFCCCPDLTVSQLRPESPRGRSWMTLSP